MLKNNKRMQAGIDKYWDENNMGEEDINAILNEHMRTPYRPFNSVPVLTGDVAKRFVDVCEYNSEYLASSQYDQGREQWVRDISQKRRNKLKQKNEKSVVCNNEGDHRQQD